MKRVGNGQILDLAAPYEDYIEGRWHDRAFCDPYVIKDPAGDGWLMYFTARDSRVESTLEAGAIGFATSPDLNQWTLGGPIFTGGFGELEVPQVIQVDENWYCLFCTSGRFWGRSAIERAGPAMTGTHYLVADNPRGPWRIAQEPALDAAHFPNRYASRIVQSGSELKLLGFRWFDVEGGPFVGAISDPDPIEVTDEGLLRIARQAGTEVCDGRRSA